MEQRPNAHAEARPGAGWLTRVARWLLPLYLVAVAAVVFQPQPTVASGTINEVHRILMHIGVPDTFTPGMVEGVINGLMFAPAALLAMLAFPRLRWAEVVCAGFIGSLTIEVVQGLFLPDRSMQAEDVVTNTFGALVGAVSVVALRWVVNLVRRRPESAVESSAESSVESGAGPT